MKKALATLLLGAAILVPAAPAQADEVDVSVPVDDNCRLTVVYYEYEDPRPWEIVDFYVLRYQCD